MKPILVLILSFFMILPCLWIHSLTPDYALAGRMALCIMLLFMAYDHFADSRGMVMMVPPYLPLRQEIVYLFCLAESTMALLLLIPAFVPATGIALILFFVLLSPIQPASTRADLQKSLWEGSGRFMWISGPLQVVLVAWVYCCTVGHI